MPRNCPPHQIVNPVTDRCVSRTGAIGRRLADCPVGFIRNPTTHRCVKINGRVGRRLLRLNPGLATQQQPNPPNRIAPPNHASMTKDQLLGFIRRLCYNTEDPISLDSWEDLNVAQLRTIVRLLDNGGVHYFKNLHLTSGTALGRKSHCFLLETIKRWVRVRVSNPNNRTPRHPVTRIPLTRDQVNSVLRLRP